MTMTATERATAALPYAQELLRDRSVQSTARLLGLVSGDAADPAGATASADPGDAR